MVLPEPVGALPQTSRPARPSGTVAAWTGKGSVMPSSSRRAHRWAGTPRAAKVGGMDGSLVERSAIRLQGGGLKPQLDTARQRLLAPEHCTGAAARSPPLGSARDGTGDGAEDVADPRAVPRADLLRARGDGRLRGARRDGLRRLLRLARGADGRGAGRGRGRHVLQLQPRRSSTTPSPPRGTSTTPEALLARAVRRRRSGAAARGGRPPRRSVGAARGRAGAHRRRRRAPPPVVRCTPATPRCRGPTIRCSRSGTPSRCCASSAATATSRASSKPGLDGIDALVLPRRVRRGAPRGAPGLAPVGRRARGTRRSRGSASAGFVDADGAFTEAGAALRQQIEDRTDALALRAVGGARGGGLRRAP